MEAYPKVLLLGSDPDWCALEEILTRYALVTKVKTVPEALALIERGPCDAFFCQWEMADGTWRSVLEEIRKRRLEVPVIVFCHCGGEHEWTDVLAGGAFDLLAPPYNSYQVGVMLEHALVSHRKITEVSA